MVDYPEVVYRLTARDEMVTVNEAWDEFAEANRSPHLGAGPVIGRSLWEFVADPTVRQIYRDLLARVREGRVVRFTFRCDSAEARRLMLMEVHPRDEGSVEFRSRTLAEDPREPQALLDPEAPRSSDLINMCSWCKKVNVAGEWRDVEQAVAETQLFEQPALPQVTHGICEPCHGEMHSILEATLRDGRG